MNLLECLTFIFQLSFSTLGKVCSPVHAVMQNVHMCIQYRTALKGMACLSAGAVEAINF